MKLLLVPLVAALLGAGWLGLASASSPDEPSSADPVRCDGRMTVECTDRGTCLVTCYDADGAVVCQRELSCDAECKPGTSCR